ncbi:MAG: hypothetical protein AB7G23_12215 [Vicinamibacterales bacterium]
MGTYAQYLQDTPVSLFLQSQAVWLWPLSETLHFIGLTLLIGATGLLDLRLLGFMKAVPIATIRQFMPLALIGFAINLVTGTLFFLTFPPQYAVSWAWWGKMAFLLVAGLNAMFFETTQGARVLSLGAGKDTPATFKIVGAVSLLAWFAVLYFGRMLPYFPELG